MRTVVAVDEWDAHYAAGRDFRPVTDEEGAAFDLNIGPGEGRPALDIGCGTGGFASFLHKRGYSVVGVDYAEAAISTANARHQPTAGLSFQCWNAEADPWTILPTHSLISCRLSCDVPVWCQWVGVSDGMSGQVVLAGRACVMGGVTVVGWYLGRVWLSWGGTPRSAPLSRERHF